MKIADIRKKSKEEQMRLMHELVAEVREFRFEMSGGRTKNVRKTRALRRDIARIQTVLSSIQEK